VSQFVHQSGQGRGCNLPHSRRLRPSSLVHWCQHTYTPNSSFKYLVVERSSESDGITTSAPFLVLAQSLDSRMLQSGLLPLMILMLSTSAFASEIVVENFDRPSHSWKSKNDPVMGGKSHGSVSIQDGVGTFDGEVVNVPFLDVPGFITMETSQGLFPDVSSCTGMSLLVRASEEYSGYRISFGNVHVPGGRFAFGYKANFSPPVGDDFGVVEIAFTNFSAKWDDATGDQIVTCAEDSKYCPTPESLRNLKTVSIWGEGVAGKVHLEILTIKAVGCDVPEMIFGQDEVTVENDEIDIESFDNVQHQWDCMNDPVMGGESTSELSFDSGVAAFEGKVAIVPFLQAPGFITMRASGGEYPDISSCTSLKLVLMAVREYHGYRISFGTIRLPNAHHATGYKANFEAPIDTFDEVIIPFTDFSSHWDDATGDQIVTCTEDAEYCPDVATLSNIKTISIWGEGVAGNVKLRIKSISAIGCGTERPDAIPQLDMSRSKQTGGFPFVHIFVFGMLGAFMVAAISMLVFPSYRHAMYDRVHEIEDLEAITAL
jgi:Complex I intermediate-associated protein 30 (CIA30)